MREYQGLCTITRRELAPAMTRLAHRYAEERNKVGLAVEVHGLEGDRG